jgi:hypothetical protein
MRHLGEVLEREAGSVPGRHFDEPPGEGMRSGEHAVSLPSPGVIEQPPSDPSIVGLLLGQAPAAGEVTVLDEGNLAKVDADGRNPAWPDGHSVEGPFVGVQREQ